MDQILNYMIKQLSIRDLLQMSKPSECKKYVLFKANSIYQHFYELRIFPSRDAKGILTFRKVDDLIHPKGDQEKERQSLCLIVAYFYTRIFQIYGALALTVIDDMNAMTSSGVMSLPLGYDARLQPPGYYPQNVYDPDRRRVGGVDFDDNDRDDRRYRRDERRDDSSKDSLKNFKWIGAFLTSDYTSSLGFKTRFTGTSSNRGVVYLKIESELKDRKGHTISSYGTPSLESYQHAVFYIGVSGMDKYASLDLYTRVETDEINVETQKLTFTNQYRESITTKQFEKSFSVEKVGGKPTYVVVSKRDKSTIDVSEYLNNYLLDIVQYLKDAIKVHKNANNNSRAVSTIRRSEDGISEHLRLEETISALMTRKPLSPCISRVLQLLKTEPFENQPGMSQICSATFAENKRLGVVKPSAPLSDSPGLFALANLFYDTITIGSPNLTIGTDREDGKPSSMDQYVAFMTNLSKRYALDKTPRIAAEYEQKGLAGIKNKRDEEKCNGTTTDIPLSLDTTRKVHGVIKTMFYDQVQHAARCLDIINMLFKTTYETTEDGKKRIKSIHLSDGLIVRGFPELYRINRLARELLIGYHSNCENKYETAVGYIIDAKDAKKNAENAAEKAKREAAEKAQQAAAAAANPQPAVAAKPQQAAAANPQRVAAANPQPPAANGQRMAGIDAAAQRAAIQAAAKHTLKSEQRATAAAAAQAAPATALGNPPGK
jgi:hypothetical protein